MKKPLVIIPARFASTRFPGKPLALIHGKPMIEQVYMRCREVCDQVVVATDDERIAAAVSTFDGEYVFTSPHHQSGTDRCAEAASLLVSKYHFDLVINVQGDEPFIDKEQLKAIIRCFDHRDTKIATLVSPILDTETLLNPNKVKVVRNIEGQALYFSRSPIPFIRDYPTNEWIEHGTFFVHIGMYAFLPETLQSITRLPHSDLELSEKLEQLRWLENGYPIATEISYKENIGIDTPEDLDKVNNMLI